MLTIKKKTTPLRNMTAEEDKKCHQIIRSSFYSYLNQNAEKITKNAIKPSQEWYERNKMNDESPCLYYFVSTMDKFEEEVFINPLNEYLKTINTNVTHAHDVNGYHNHVYWTFYDYDFFEEVPFEDRAIDGVFVERAENNGNFYLQVEDKG